MIKTENPHQHSLVEDMRNVVNEYCYNETFPEEKLKEEYFDRIFNLGRIFKPAPTEIPQTIDEIQRSYTSISHPMGPMGPQYTLPYTDREARDERQGNLSGIGIDGNLGGFVDFNNFGLPMIEEPLIGGYQPPVEEQPVIDGCDDEHSRNKISRVIMELIEVGRKKYDMFYNEKEVESKIKAMKLSELQAYQKEIKKAFLNSFDQKFTTRCIRKGGSMMFDLIFHFKTKGFNISPEFKESKQNEILDKLETCWRVYDTFGEFSEGLLYGKDIRLKLGFEIALELFNLFKDIKIEINEQKTEQV